MTSASGTTNGRNVGGPTDTMVPVIASEMSGKKVNQKMTAVSATRTRFCSRKIASREKIESSWASVRRLSRRRITSPTEPMIITPIERDEGGVQGRVRDEGVD